MIGIEPALGFLATWIGGKLGKAVENRVDSLLESGLTRLHDLVQARMSGDSAYEKFESELSDGVENPRTRERVRLSLEDLCEQDPEFARELEALVEQLVATQQASGIQTGDNGQVFTGDVSIKASGGSAAAVSMGDVSIGGARQDPR
ncbi:hypothetical protein D5S17_02185 [Pseudonocardiaceae bacterium YIM PH 21723]|nr:hypothetical protein D5S17_02185 [Pseudonocardiaceae bacterium YIM PH 21723]